MANTVENVVLETTANVVKNDYTPSTHSARNNAASLLAEIESKRIAWEQDAYRKSNQALYAVLADCLLYAGNLDSAEAHKQRSKALDEFYKVRGYQIRENTPLITRVVRAVFGGIDRRRTSTYSLVLRQAKAEGIQATQLADWIERKGGIQEIKLSHSKSYISPKQKAETAQNSISSLQTLAVVKTEALSMLADPDHIHSECVLLATQQPDGSFVVKALLRGGVVTAAYSSLYSQMNPQVQAQKAEVKAANDANGTASQAA